MTGQSILVTGGAGFIGSHTCKLLASDGFIPVTYDNLSTGNLSDVRYGPFVQGELGDVGKLVDTINKYRPVAVMHFAALAYVGESVEHPARYYGTNVGGTLSLLGACHAMQLDKIVFSSSCATYGVPDRLPITEQTPQMPINPYGVTKLIVERILQDYRAAYGLQSVILRYFNACGADPDGELSEKHSPETHIIPLALMAASGRAERLRIFGTDYETKDGTCVRDYIHVSDLARAHVLAVRHLLQGKGSMIVNLGSGIGISILEILDTVRQQTGHDVPVQIAPRRPGDPPALYADPAFAEKALGFRTEMSDIGSIIKTAAPTFGLEVRS
ncbi:UDP-glucose 4-epimerase GalE [Cohaesibacter haloalkalitolerans]|uniref:UDP-glucose 4-epimerase GalE n=1 Tax=Cohaesibacter haloalkalitolerans TaxID=1162980 RepID=UPI000E6564F2|nr:UDP-glucose 4-epimerase GalE [Cohaesibacter haloalkalitolerans]